MMSIASTKTNQTKLSQIERVWSTLLAEALQRGFYGSVSLQLVIADGTIQNLQRRIEQVER
ncbi:MAG TPA: hypothetical protein VHV77_13250 [Pirellulales bacterium]|jgi:hypothetical protein|nr:hypothetical protein [Pirellulales bacterium]